jgi:hypothetical protein
MTNWGRRAFPINAAHPGKIIAGSSLNKIKNRRSFGTGQRLFSPELLREIIEKDPGEFHAKNRKDKLPNPPWIPVSWFSSFR